MATQSKRDRSTSRARADDDVPADRLKMNVRATASSAARCAPPEMSSTSIARDPSWNLSRYSRTASPRPGRGPRVTGRSVMSMLTGVFGANGHGPRPARSQHHVEDEAVERSHADGLRRCRLEPGLVCRPGRDVRGKRPGGPIWASAVRPHGRHARVHADVVARAGVDAPQVVPGRDEQEVAGRVLVVRPAGRDRVGEGRLEDLRGVGPGVDRAETGAALRSWRRRFSLRTTDARRAMRSGSSWGSVRALWSRRSIRRSL